MGQKNIKLFKLRLVILLLVKIIRNGDWGLGIGFFGFNETTNE